MPTITVKDASGSDVEVEAPLTPGRKADAGSSPVVLATQDLAAINAITTALDGGLAVSGAFFQDTQPVSAVSLPLPDGAASDASLTTIAGLLSDNATGADVSSVVTALQGVITVDGSGATQPVSASALPLPSGAATEAKQDATVAGVAKLETAKDGFGITPNDSSDLATRPDAIFVGTAGDIVAHGTSGNPMTFKAYAGQVIPFSPARILATGTTADDLVGLTV